MKTLSADALRVALLLASLSATALAQGWETNEGKPVSVASEGAMLQVRVGSTVPLSEVLSELCSKQRIQCSGTESLAGFPVPSMTLSGTVEQVIFNLLQGTEMNYSILRTDSGGLSKLTVLGRAPAGTQSANAGAGPKNVAKDTAQGPQASDMTESKPYSEPESAEESARSDRVMEMIFGGASKASGETGSAANAAPGGAIASANASLPEFLPFPDQFGNPIRTTPMPAATYLPFPDHNGHPIPTTPVLVQGPPIPLSQ